MCREVFKFVGQQLLLLALNALDFPRCSENVVQKISLLGIVPLGEKLTGVFTFTPHAVSWNFWWERSKRVFNCKELGSSDSPQL